MSRIGCIIISIIIIYLPSVFSRTHKADIIVGCPATIRLFVTMHILFLMLSFQQLAWPSS